jgi:hypothetical protein
LDLNHKALAGNVARDRKSGVVDTFEGEEVYFELIDPMLIALAISGNKELNEAFSSAHTGRIKRDVFMFHDHLPEVSMY